MLVPLCPVCLRNGWHQPTAPQRCGLNQKVLRPPPPAVLRDDGTTGTGGLKGGTSCWGSMCITLVPVGTHAGAGY